MKLLAILVLLPVLLPAQEARKIQKICDAGDAALLGLACSEDDPCPVFLELSGIGDSGGTLVIAGNLHTVNTTIYGLLLITQDRGQTWTDRRIRATTLDQVQFFDRERGWVSGARLEPIPKDPFLLITQDGGRSWKASQIFEDARLGTISQFRFTSAAEGQIIVDSSQGRTLRFERFETNNAGASWTSKETADHELRLPAAEDGASSNWRLRLDGEVYRVENRSTGDWETAARFAVNAGECK